MNLMTAGALFCFNYLTEVLPSFKISLNLSSWNGHITPSLTETIYQAPFSLMCFTETASYGANFKDIQSYKNNWKPFHKFTSHNHVICYQTCKISFVEELYYYYRTHWDTASLIQSKWYTYVNNFDISTIRQDRNLYCLFDWRIALTSRSPSNSSIAWFQYWSKILMQH